MNVGFVGLGAMGGQMAKRLLDAGYEVSGYNRTPARAAWLEADGLRLLDSPRAVAASTGLVLSMVRDDDALRAVTLGDEGILAGLQPGAIYVDLSTVSPALSRELAGMTASGGAGMLDAPVSGTVETIRRGALAIMVGGDRALLERAQPVLAAIGPTITHIGGNGQAALMKLAINLGLFVQMTAFSEGILLAERGGIPREVAVEAMLASVAASPMVRYRAPFVLEGGLPDPAWFDCRMAQKDLVLALDAARSRSVPLPTAAVTNELLTACIGAGLGGEDFAAVFQLLARLAGGGREGGAS